MADEEIERLRSRLQHAYDEPRQSSIKEILGRLKRHFARPKPKPELKSQPKPAETPKGDKAA